MCLTEDIDPITETGKNDDMAGDDDAVIAGNFVVRYASFLSAVSQEG